MPNGSHSERDASIARANVAQRAPAKPAIEVVRELIQARLPELEKILPEGMSAERFMRTTLIALSKSPAILACTPTSILRCMLEAAGEGLEPTGLFGGAWLVPFKDNKTGTMVCTLIRSYVGLMKLVRRSGEIANMQARLIREGDEVVLEYGLQQQFVHKPIFGNSNPVIAAYSLVHFKNGHASVEIMSTDEIEKVRAASRARSSGPWVDWWEEMARKTVLRRHAKYLPLDDVAATAITADDEASGSGFGASEARTPAERVRMIETKEGMVYEQETRAGSPAEPGDSDTESAPEMGS